MPISFETYQKIQELYEIGLTKRRIAKKLGITEKTVTRWVTADESTFYELKNTRFFYLDQYKEFLLEQIRACPQIKTTNLYYKTQDAFSDFDCPRSAFYRYVLQLKRDYGFEKFTGRQTKPREDTPPGYEAQVDFGQSKMLDMYGRQIRVYFFCMVLSFSRMHFVYFSAEPFIPGQPSKPTNTPSGISAAGRRPSCTTRIGYSSSAKTSGTSSSWNNSRTSSRKSDTAWCSAAREIRRPKARWNPLSGMSRRIFWSVPSFAGSIH